MGISPDSQASHQRFIAKNSLRLALLSDPEHEVLESYEVWAWERMYGREYQASSATILMDPQGTHGSPRERWSGSGETLTRK